MEGETWVMTGSEEASRYKDIFMRKLVSWQSSVAGMVSKWRFRAESLADSTIR
jgi:hypothetical protein